MKKSLSKIEKIPKQNLIFMNFGMKSFIVRNDFKKKNKTLVFECYNLVELVELGVVMF
jgi:hypothetical protein